MPVIKQVLSARTSLTVTGFSTLASGNFVTSSIYTCNTNQPVDVIVECEATPNGTTSGNKQVVLFIQESLDGTTFRTGPTTGTIANDEPNLRVLGSLPTATSSSLQRGTFSVMQALGYVPYAFRIVAKNELGVALTAGALYTSEISNLVI